MWGLLIAAVVLVLIGGALLLLTPQSPASFTCAGGIGGTACTFSGMIFVTPARIAGALCGLAGLLLVAGALGWVLGRRARTERPGATPAAETL